MGNRGQVKINGVYLYTHWGANELVKDVQRALRKRWRWHDTEYLARIIFEEMIGDEKGTETGFGIGTMEHNDCEKIIKIIDFEDISVYEPFEDKIIFEGTFEEFLKLEVE